MAPFHPILFIPPGILILAIIGLLAHRYRETARLLALRQAQWLEAFRQSNDESLRGAAQANFGQDFEFEDEYLDDGEDFEENEELENGDDRDDGTQQEVEPQGTTTSARLRMHHDMVQQMRVRAGFAPEPFPGDIIEEAEANDQQNEDGDEENDGGGGPSTGVASTRIRKIGKKKAEKLQRKEQMRAYHEFMTMQREERRQQEEMFRMQESHQLEERQRQRAAQMEKDRKRKEQSKQREAKENDNKVKKMQTERMKDEKARKELRAYIQKVKSFNVPTLAKRLGRSESQLTKDLAAITSESDDLTQDETSPRIFMASSLASLSSNPSSPPTLPITSSSRPHLLLLYMKASDQYVILDQSALASLSSVVKSKGKIGKMELCEFSKAIFANTEA
ncbi:hypothetical protein BGZ59_001620 [Podila verticillata]|nr:hypothetical protein BGZ59_001620 [Podila verticillata]KFH73705.1 hypothetical protein MVEG_00919 [Podila verticillata NRRL 6337]